MVGFDDIMVLPTIPFSGWSESQYRAMALLQLRGAEQSSSREAPHFVGPRKGRCVQPAHHCNEKEKRKKYVLYDGK